MCFALAAMSPSDSLPTDLDGLRALLLAERAHHAEELERLTAIIKELQRHRFGRRGGQKSKDFVSVDSDRREMI
jgi:hypothetical protein